MKSDKVGIASAILCTIHCLAIPVFFAIKFAWAAGSQINFPGWWGVIDYVFLAISFSAVYHSAGHTPNVLLRRYLWIFWLLLAISVIFESWIHWLAYFASAGLVACHMINLRQMRKTEMQQKG